MDKPQTNADQLNTMSLRHSFALEAQDQPVKVQDDIKIWHLVTLEVTRDAEEFAGSMLFELGTTGIVTLEEHSDLVKLGAYFDWHLETEPITQAIQSEFERAGRASDLHGVSVCSVPEQDWMQKWKEGFEPIAISNRLIIAPSWKLPDEIEGRVIVQIDPGMAFGTGTHETTRMCLEAIEAYWRGSRLLDVGCGTGVLAISAALLAKGSRITAIDVDPQAVEVARENATINAVANSIEIMEGQAREFVGGEFDLVVANLTGEVIISLIEELYGCLAAAGMMILSGILTTVEADVQNAAIAIGLTIVERRHLGEWSALVARKK